MAFVSSPAARADRLARRSVLGGALAAIAVTARPGSASPALPSLRGEVGERLPDHATLWSRMPLPFTPAQAWRLLIPETQAEIGAAVIGMVLADYVSGDMHVDEADHFLDGDLRSTCIDVRDQLTGAISHRLWAIFPDLYGPDGDHPAWAINVGMVLPLGAVSPELRPAAVERPDPIYAAIETAAAAELEFRLSLIGIDEDDAVAMADADALGARSDTAFDALTSTRPTTYDGLVALLKYLGEEASRNDGCSDGGRTLLRLAATLRDGPLLV